MYKRKQACEVFFAFKFSNLNQKVKKRSVRIKTLYELSSSKQLLINFEKKVAFTKKKLSIARQFGRTSHLTHKVTNSIC